MLEPIAFAYGQASCPSSAAVAETSISGAEVPKATTVNPMIIVEMPAFLARRNCPIDKLVGAPNQHCQTDDDRSEEVKLSP